MTSPLSGLSRIRKPELLAAFVTAAVVLVFVVSPGTAEGVEVTLEPETDDILLGQTFTLTARIEIPVDQFVSSIEIGVEGPATFSAMAPLEPGPFDLSDSPGVSGQLTGTVEFPDGGVGYGYDFGFGYGYGAFDEGSGFGYGYGFGDGFGSGYGYGYSGGEPGGSIVVTINYVPVIDGTYTLTTTAVSNLGDGPILAEGELTFTVFPEPVPPPGSKVTLCHIPPGNAAAAHVITVGAPAVRAHVAHGDVVSDTCPDGAAGDGDGESASTVAGGSSDDESTDDRDGEAKFTPPGQLKKSSSLALGEAPGAKGKADDSKAQPTSPGEPKAQGKSDLAPGRQKGK